MQDSALQDRSDFAGAIAELGKDRLPVLPLPRAADRGDRASSSRIARRRRGLEHAIEVEEGPPRDIVRMDRRFPRSSTGATQASVPAKCAAHSSRVRLAMTAAISSRLALRGKRQALEQRLPELRLDRADREELAVEAAIDAVVRTRRRRAGWPPARRASARPPASP